MSIVTSYIVLTLNVVLIHILDLLFFQEGALLIFLFEIGKVKAVDSHEREEVDHQEATYIEDINILVIATDVLGPVELRILLEKEVASHTLGRDEEVAHRECYHSRHQEPSLVLEIGLRVALSKHPLHRPHESDVEN